MAPPTEKPVAINCPLTRVKTGAHSVVVSLVQASAHERNKLMAMGVMPGTSIHLQQKFPTYVIGVGYTTLALDKETAALILVKPETA